MAVAVAIGSWPKERTFLLIFALTSPTRYNRGTRKRDRRDELNFMKPAEALASLAWPVHKVMRGNWT